MARTSLQIVDDVMTLLRGSGLSAGLSGGIYHEGERPRDSRKEDMVVIFTASNASQIQSGVVTVNIFVPDHDARGDGVLVMDGVRCKEIETAAQEWFDSVTCADSDYRFRLSQAICTDSEPSIGQHFVVIRLGFEHLS